MKEQSQAPKELYLSRELVPEREYQRVAISGEEKCGVATALFFTLLFCLLYKNKMLLTEQKWTLQTLHKLLRENQVSHIHTQIHKLLRETWGDSNTAEGFSQEKEENTEY